MTTPLDNWIKEEARRICQAMPCGCRDCFENGSASKCRQSSVESSLRKAVEFGETRADANAFSDGWKTGAAELARQNPKAAYERGRDEQAREIMQRIPAGSQWEPVVQMVRDSRPSAFEEGKDG